MCHLEPGRSLLRPAAINLPPIAIDRSPDNRDRVAQFQPPNDRIPYAGAATDIHVMTNHPRNPQRPGEGFVRGVNSSVTPFVREG